MVELLHLFAENRLNATTLLFARQPLAHARGSEQSRDRQKV
jgi:hypothetical protein